MDPEDGDMLRIMVSQPLGRRRSRLLFYIILIFVLITTVSWLRTTTTTYVSVTNIRSFEPYPSHPLCLPMSIPNRILFVQIGTVTWKRHSEVIIERLRSIFTCGNCDVQPLSHKLHKMWQGLGSEKITTERYGSTKKPFLFDTLTSVFEAHMV